MATSTKYSLCAICDEKVTVSRNTTCPYCQFHSCRTCVRKYVLNETHTKCMNCNKLWTRTHQNTILLPSFVNEQLRVHQEQVYYEREMALFPVTIEVIEDRRTVDRLTREYRLLLEELSVKSAKTRYVSAVIRENKKLIQLKTQQPKMYSDVNVAELNAQNATLKRQYAIDNEEYTKVETKINISRAIISMYPEDRKIVLSNYIEGANPFEILETLRRTGQLGEASRRSRTQFIRACPVETCRGFLNQQWKCGICNVYTCSNCNVPKCNVPKDTAQKKKREPSEEKEEDEHVCNPDDVATAELLAKDTKPCPQCGTGIFKIDGCDQMWCTECRTAFNWRTGQLETGHVHNPHYFEYQRRIGADARNILDMPCNALAPDQYHGILHHLIHVATNANSSSLEEREKRGLSPLIKETKQRLRERVDDYAVSIHDFSERLLPRYRPDAIQNNQELRIQYLTEQITKEDFKSALSREAKQFNKKIEIGQVIQTVIFGMSDILTRLIGILRESHDQNTNSNYIDSDRIFALLSEIDALIEYANECLDFICKQYKLTRVAIFIRDERKKHQPGLYTLKIEEGDQGKVIHQVRAM